MSLAQRAAVTTVLQAYRGPATAAATANVLLTMFEDMGLAYDARIQPWNVGWDPVDTSMHEADGLSLGRVMQALQETGFIGACVRHAICCESGEAREAIQARDKAWHEENQVQPATGCLEWGCLSCGLVNMSLRVLVTRSDFFPEMDAELADVATRGMWWKVLRQEVRAEFPAALNIIEAPSALASVHTYVHISHPCLPA